MRPGRIHPSQTSAAGDCPASGEGSLHGEVSPSQGLERLLSCFLLHQAFAALCNAGKRHGARGGAHARAVLWRAAGALDAAQSARQADATYVQVQALRQQLDSAVAERDAAVAKRDAAEIDKWTAKTVRRARNLPALRWWLCRSRPASSTPLPPLLMSISMLVPCGAGCQHGVRWSASPTGGAVALPPLAARLHCLHDGWGGCCPRAQATLFTLCCGRKEALHPALSGCGCDRGLQGLVAAPRWRPPCRHLLPTRQGCYPLLALPLVPLTNTPLWQGGHRLTAQHA